MNCKQITNRLLFVLWCLCQDQGSFIAFYHAYYTDNTHSSQFHLSGLRRGGEVSKLSLPNDLSFLFFRRMITLFLLVENVRTVSLMSDKLSLCSLSWSVFSSLSLPQLCTLVFQGLWLYVMCSAFEVLSFIQCVCNEGRLERESSVSMGNIFDSVSSPDYNLCCNGLEWLLWKLVAGNLVHCNNEKDN